MASNSEVLRLHFAFNSLHLAEGELVNTPRLTEFGFGPGVSTSFAPQFEEALRLSSGAYDELSGRLCTTVRVWTHCVDTH